MNDKIEKTFKITGRKEDVDTIGKILRHIEYLGRIGASRNLLIRVDGDGWGRITVVDENGNPIDTSKHNTDQAITRTAIVGTYDIG